MNVKNRFCTLFTSGKKSFKIIYAVIVAVSLSVACKKDNSEGTQIIIDVEEISAHIEILNEEGSFVPSVMPSETVFGDENEDLALRISDIKGTQVIFKDLEKTDTIITNKSDLTTLYVSIQNYNGYFAIPLYPTLIDTIYTFNLKLKSNPDVKFYYLIYAVVNEARTVSEHVAVKYITGKGSLSDLSVEFNWQDSNFVDLDLYVIEPSNDTVYYDKTSENHGELIKDSNKQCWIDGANTEKVEYGKFAYTQAGKYTVKAQLYSLCNHGSLPVTYNTIIQLGNDTIFFEGYTTIRSGIIDTSVVEGDFIEIGSFNIESD